MIQALTPKKNIMVPMRDGVELATDIYRLTERSVVPALVVRMPYDKERYVSPEMIAFVKAGYAVLVQDTRGRFASQGDFNPNFQEINDGADCYAWVAQQPWCNGHLGTMGTSYLGQSQWLAAPHMPEAVKAMIVMLAPVDHYSDIAYRGGVLDLGSMLFWCSMMAIGEQERRLEQGQANREDVQQQAAALGDLMHHYERLPPRDMVHLKGVSPHFFNWLDHPAYDAYWQTIDARHFEQLDQAVLHIGPRDQQTIEDRQDVLVYSTPVLTAPLEVIGPVKAILYVSSSAPDTDVTCKLVDVYPDGRAMLLTDGILRLRYRHSFTEPVLLERDEIVAVQIDLWSTANVFLPGHQLRLEVSSSCFPKFARNSNTGGDIAGETAEQYQPAINRVFHDAAHASHLILPIIER